MENRVKLTLPEKVKYHTNILLKHDSSYHVFFWITLFVILTLLDNQGSVGFRVVKELINVSFFALMAYINLQFLFSAYLKKKNLITHVILVLLTAVLITPIKTAVLYLISPNTSELQPYLLSNMYSIFFSTAFIGLATTEYGIIREWLKSQQEKKELKREKLESELKFLRTQLNPHFLFNTLNSLYALTLKKSDLAPEIVLKLSEAMRYMLYECNVDNVPLVKEINYLENYIDLERTRHGENVDIQFSYEGDPEGHQVSPLIFLPFIENSFKHGIATNADKRYVDIHMNITQDQIKLTVENNKGVQYPKAAGFNKKSGGIGLKNITKRLKLLYPDQYILNILEKEDTYKVTLLLDLDKNKEK